MLDRIALCRSRILNFAQSCCRTETFLEVNVLLIRYGSTRCLRINIIAVVERYEATGGGVVGELSTAVH